MRILWITNTISAKVAHLVGQRTYYSGGWTDAMADYLASSSANQFAIATTANVDKLYKNIVGGITYYTIPKDKKVGRVGKLKSNWIAVVGDFEPDVIHIYGTEYADGLSCIEANPREKYIISIQGLPGIISRYYAADIKIVDVIKNITVRDLIRLDMIVFEQFRWRRKADLERRYFNAVQHVDGRTSWDFAHVKRYNRQLSYHHCDRVLRPQFYAASKWSLRTRTPFTIFVSQAADPFKGLHKLLGAVSMLRDDYPSILVVVGGQNIIRGGSIANSLRRSTFGKYLSKLIAGYGLRDAVKFTGELSESEMVSAYQQAHVFVCPSSIENSPNSVGEAQFLGVPVVAAYVGGVPDYVSHGSTGLLYRFEEVEMLAECLRSIFSDDDLALRLSRNAINVAEHRHDRRRASARLLEIYDALQTPAFRCGDMRSLPGRKT